MILSERGAIRAAIAKGCLHLYPAGRFIDYIKSALQGDDLKGNFDGQTTPDKLKSITPPQDKDTALVFAKDLELICKRLQEMSPEYDIAKVFTSLNEGLPSLAKRYYGIEDFTFATPQVVEYYFEGHSDLYKDGDWFAFNVTKAESKELSVPVGTYFKRDQVSPGNPEFCFMHEANHAMQEIASVPDGVHHYVPWLDEGLADIFGKMMLFAATGDEELLSTIKTFRTEVEVTDKRKVTYHYGEETAALLLFRGRLPLVRALLKARKESPYNVDWNGLALAIKSGIDPHIAIINAYKGPKKDLFQRRLLKNETEARKEADLNQSDLRVLTMFLATTPPAVLSASEYLTASWLIEEIQKTPSAHFADPCVIPEALKPQVPNWNENCPIPVSSIPEGVAAKIPAIKTKILIKESDVPLEFRAQCDSLANNYFIVKRKIGEAEFYEPYGGGLPFRMGSGELRCAW